MQAVVYILIIGYNPILKVPDPDIMSWVMVECKDAVSARLMSTADVDYKARLVELIFERRDIVIKDVILNDFGLVDPESTDYDEGDLSNEDMIVSDDDQPGRLDAGTYYYYLHDIDSTHLSDDDGNALKLLVTDSVYRVSISY